jgi:Phage integrase, N-terminal SAM-like domain
VEQQHLPEFPPLKEAVEAFLEEQVALNNLRASTAAAYRDRLKTWAWPSIGARPWNLVTRDEVTAIMLALRKAGKSTASIEQIRCPLTKFYQWQIAVHHYAGPNPTADLRHVIGKQPGKKARKHDLQWFGDREVHVLLQAADQVRPRWREFIRLGWGRESVAGKRSPSTRRTSTGTAAGSTCSVPSLVRRGDRLAAQGRPRTVGRDPA